MRPLLASLVNLLFPARCLGCEKQGISPHPPLFCPACRAKIIPFTPSCAPKGDFPFTAYSLCIYQEPISSLLRRLKFQGDLSSLSSIAALARETEAKLLPPKPDLLLPVPLHRSRQRWPGFNQAILLAKA